MRSIVTGANGMLGRNLVRLLALAPDSEVAALVRTDARRGFERFLACEGLVEQVRILEGELATGGAPAAEFGDADHVFHLAGKSDWNLSTEDTATAAGLDCRLATAAAALAEACGARRLHAPSLQWCGASPPPVVQVKRAEERTLLDSDAAVRIYRLPVLAGRSDTGEADANCALNGLHLVIRQLALQLPGSVTLTLRVPGVLQVLPADVAAASLIALADAELPQSIVEVADPHPTSLVEVANVVSAAAGGPRFAAAEPAAASGGDDSGAIWSDAMLRDLLTRAGCPPALLEWIRQPVAVPQPAVLDCLHRAGVAMPPWRDYAGRCYRYWSYALDPQR